MAKIGFIGLGNMGAHMARNLIKAGHSLKVYDLNEEAVRYVAQSGATAAASAAEAASGVEFAITMLPVGANVRDALVGAGALAAASPGTVVIDSSTIDVETARAMHEAAAAAGLEFLDAPVSGGVMGAEGATLTFMCGGAPEVFAKARPILEAMGKNIVLCGGPGQGQVTKICNNMVAAINMLAVAEAFVMGETLGVDRKVLQNVLSTSTAESVILTRSCPMPGAVPNSAASNGFKPGFAAKLMLKVLRLAQAASLMAGTSTPLGAAAASAYAIHIANGHGEEDMASIVKLIKPDVA
jgi:3-hydroxyisobutyrate dehydrogenase